MKKLITLYVFCAFLVGCGPPNDEHTQTGMRIRSIESSSPTTIETIGTSESPGELRGCDGMTDGQLMVVKGFWSPNDGGGGSFLWDSGCTDLDNGGTTIVPAGYGAGQGADAGMR